MPSVSFDANRVNNRSFYIFAQANRKPAFRRVWWGLNMPETTYTEYALRSIPAIAVA